MIFRRFLTDGTNDRNRRQNTAGSDSILLEKEFEDISKQITSRHGETLHPIAVNGLSDGARAVFYAAMIRKTAGKRPALIIVPDEKEGLKLSNALGELSVKTLTYPLREVMFRKITSAHD